MIPVQLYTCNYSVQHFIFVYVQLCRKVGERLRTLRDRDQKMTETLAQVSRIGLLDEKLSGLIRTVEYMSEQMKDLTEELTQAKSELKKNRFLEQEMTALKNQNKHMKKRLNEQDNYSCRENMEITGIEEAPNESCRAVCNKLFKEGMGIMKDIELVRCHRIGRQYPQGRRPILVQFRFYEDKEIVMTKRSNLRGSGVYLNEDLCLDSKRKRASLIPILKELKKIDVKTNFPGDKLAFHGHLFDENNLHDLPIDPHNACTKTANRVTLFAGKFSKLSNLHQCSLNIDGRLWTSVEQFYQFSKATMMGQQEVAAFILGTDDAVEAMNLGKAINSDNPQWKNSAEEVMQKALDIKFAIPPFKLALNKTEKFIGEVTRHPVLGTGSTMAHKDAFNTRSWTGKNTLGLLLAKSKAKLCK